MGLPMIPEPRRRCQSTLPELRSTAKKSPFKAPKKARPPSVTSAPPQVGYGFGISHTVSPVRKLNFLNLPVVPGFSGYMYTLANTYTVPCCVCERACGSSSMHQLLVGQYAMPGSPGSIAQGCWSLPPIADGQAWVLPLTSSGEGAGTFTGRPVFMSTFSAQVTVT